MLEQIAESLAGTGLSSRAAASSSVLLTSTSVYRESFPFSMNLRQTIDSSSLSLYKLSDTIGASRVSPFQI